MKSVLKNFKESCVASFLAEASILNISSTTRVYYNTGLFSSLYGFTVSGYFIYFKNSGIATHFLTASQLSNL